MDSLTKEELLSRIVDRLIADKSETAPIQALEDQRQRILRNVAEFNSAVSKPSKKEKQAA